MPNDHPLPFVVSGEEIDAEGSEGYFFTTVPTTHGSMELGLHEGTGYMFRFGAIDQLPKLEEANVPLSMLENDGTTVGVLIAPAHFAIVCEILGIRLISLQRHDWAADTQVVIWETDPDASDEDEETEATVSEDPEPEPEPEPEPMTPWGAQAEMPYFSPIYSGVSDKNGCPAVVVTDWNGMKPDYMADMANRIKAIMGTWLVKWFSGPRAADDIRASFFKYLRITVPHGKQSPVMLDREDTITVHIWGTPEDTSQFTPQSIETIPGYLFGGLRPGVRDYCFPRPVGSVPVFDTFHGEDQDEVVAFMTDPWNIYIPFDSIHKNRVEDIRITSKIVEAAMALLKIGDGQVRFTDKAVSMIGKTVQEIFYEKSKEQFEAHFVNHVTQRAYTLKDEASNLMQHKDYLLAQLTEQIRAIENKQAELEASRIPEEEVARRADTQFRQIMKNPKATLAKAISDGIEITTSMLYVQDPRTTLCHEIGEMSIKILFNGSYRFQNKTRRVNAHSDNMHAVHVFEDGNACLGNLEAAIPDLIAKMEIATVAGFMIDFACSANEEDACGKYVGSWPVVNYLDLPELFQREFEKTTENTTCTTSPEAVTRARCKPEAAVDAKSEYEQASAA